MSSFSRLNNSMSCEPNSEELIYSIATRQETNRRAINKSDRPIIDLNFIPAPLNSIETEIVLFIKNIGSVPTDW